MESWTVKKAEHWKIDAFELWCWRRLESPLDCKDIQQVHSEGDQPWDFLGRNDAKAETPVLWPPHAKSWLIGKDSDAGRDWGQEDKGTTEDEMAGWHHRLDGLEFGWTLGVCDGQGVLACCNLWGRKESDTTEWLNCTEMMFSDIIRYLLTIHISSLEKWLLSSSAYFLIRLLLLFVLSCMSSIYILKKWLCDLQISIPFVLDSDLVWYHGRSMNINISAQDI